MLKNTKNYRRAGFTLTEVAVVLLLVSVLVGSIFAYAGRTSNQANVFRVSQQVLEIVKNIREAYANVYRPNNWATSTTPIVDVTTGAGSVDSIAAFPAEMRSDPAIDLGAVPQKIKHALGQDLFVYSIYSSSAAISKPNPPTVCTTIPCFRVEVRGLNKEACISLSRSLQIDDQAFDILQLSIYNTGACFGASSCQFLSSATGIPTLSQATTDCDDPTNNYVLWDFKLH